MAIRRLIGVITLLVACAMVVTGCRKELSTPLVEQMVEGYYMGAVRVEVDASCPENVEMLTSNHFMCSFTYGKHGERDGWVVVMQHDRYGRITFYRSDPVDHERAERILKEWLATNHDLDLDPTCPRDVVPLEGFKFECTAGDRTIRVNQTRGNLEFSFHLVGSAPGEKP